MHETRITLRGCLVGMAGIGVILSLRNYYLATTFGQDAPLNLFVIPILLAAGWGDWRSGLLTMLVGTAAGAIWCIQDPPFDITTALDQARVARITVVGTVLITLVEGLHVARHRHRLVEAHSASRQRRLDEMSENLRLVTDSMQVPVARCDRQFRYVWVSNCYGQWIGRPASEICGLSLEQVLGSSAVAHLRPYFERVLEGEQVEIEELVDFGAKGRRWIHAIYAPTGAPGAPPDGWVSVVLDVTQRKQIEHELAEGNRRRDEFLAVMAHELRNPLAPLQHSLEALAHVADRPPEVARLAGVMERQLGHMTRFVDDLLDVSRISRGEIPLRREPVDLNAVLTEVEAAARPLVDERGQWLSLSLPGEPLWVAGDCDRLAQVFVNLLHNAAKYTPRGGTITVSAGGDGQGTVVRVRDNGIGIAREMQPLIFEMFRRVDSGPQSQQDGLGIGLHLVRRIVELHGGSATVHSQGLGHGSEFEIRLPATVARPTAPPATVARRTAAAGEARRVLIVDDNADAAESLAELLRIRGHQVTVRLDGRQALDWLREEACQVALVDLSMPEMDGYELARQARRSHNHEPLTLVALTGHLGGDVLRRAEAAGFDHYLTKPAQLAELERLLGDHRAGPDEGRGPLAAAGERR